VRFRDTRPAGARIFETRLRVQFADIDLAGIMYFAAYWRYVERAEMDMFADLGFPYASIFDEFDVWMPRVHAVGEYHAPALIDDWLTMRTHVEKVGVASCVWKTVVFNERTGQPGADFTLTIVCMDRSSHKSRPLPSRIREALVAAWGAPA